MCSEANDVQQPIEIGDMGGAVDGQAVQLMPKIGTPIIGTRPSSSLSVNKSLANSRVPNTELAVYISSKPCTPRPSTRNSNRHISHGTRDLPTVGVKDGAMRSFSLVHGSKDAWNDVELPPPWGADRANSDIPPWEQVQQRRQKYCKMLDEQVLEKSRLKRYRCEQELKLDQDTETSLDTNNNSRHFECANADRERAIYKELIATVGYRQRSERERKRSEQQNARMCEAQAELQIAWSWHVKREEEKQTKVRMAQEWSSVAQHRQHVREFAKTLALREEKDLIQRTNRGLVPRRRLRRGRQDCIASNHTPTRAHVAWAARS